MRLVDAEEVKQIFDYEVSEGATDLFDAFDTAIESATTVRCEECLYRSQYPDGSGNYKCGGLLTEDEELLLMVKPDFFCGYYKRR